ncbi:MAG: hypothetical protein AB7E45_01935 [Candidatus Caldatribacteriota bacterium]
MDKIFIYLVESGDLGFNKGLYHINLNIDYYDSITSYGLQAVDFVTHSIFKNYEYGNKKYIAVIEGNIRQNIQGEFFPLRSPGLKAKYIVNYLVIIFILFCSIEIF